jgi:hypothetical protein
MIKKIITQSQFEEFIGAYPNALETHTSRIFDPPLLTYNDFSTGKQYPASVVASIVLYTTYDPSAQDVHCLHVDD